MRSTSRTCITRSAVGRSPGCSASGAKRDWLWAPTAAACTSPTGTSPWPSSSTGYGVRHDQPSQAVARRVLRQRPRATGRVIAVGQSLRLGSEADDPGVLSSSPAVRAEAPGAVRAWRSVLPAGRGEDGQRPYHKPRLRPVGVVRRDGYPRRDGERAALAQPAHGRAAVDSGATGLPARRPSGHGRRLRRQGKVLDGLESTVEGPAGQGEESGASAEVSG